MLFELAMNEPALPLLLAVPDRATLPTYNLLLSIFYFIFEKAEPRPEIRRRRADPVSRGSDERTRTTAATSRARPGQNPKTVTCAHIKVVCEISGRRTPCCLGRDDVPILAVHHLSDIAVRFRRISDASIPHKIIVRISVSDCFIYFPFHTSVTRIKTDAVAKLP